MLTEKFPEQAFDPIALHGTTDFPAGGDAKAGHPLSVADQIDDKVSGVELASRTPNPLKISRSQQPVSGGESVFPTSHHCYRLLAGNGYGKNFPSPSPAALKDIASIFGLHPRTKSMAALATNFARLVGSF